MTTRVKKIMEEVDKNVKYDEAELVSNWSKEDLLDFINHALTQVEEEQIEEIASIGKKK